MPSPTPLAVSQPSNDDRAQIISLLEHNQEVFQILLAFVQMSKGFKVAFAEINFPPDVDVLMTALQEHPKCEAIQFAVLRFDDPDLRFLLEAIKQELPKIEIQPDKKLVLVLQGLEKAIASTGDNPPTILTNLNYARDSFPVAVPHPVLFALPEHDVTRLAQFAPDFWAWTSATFKFYTPNQTYDEIILDVSDNFNNFDDDFDVDVDQPEITERISLLEKLLQEYREDTEANNRLKIEILNQLGQTYQSIRNFQKAKFYFQKAIFLSRKYGYKNTEDEVLQNLQRASFHQEISMVDNKPIILTMLGATNSGKTSYMSAMYAFMERGLGLNGYSLESKNLDDSIHLEEIWNNIVQGEENRFPSATFSMYEYNFTLLYGLNTPITSFNWLDYRGSAISGSDDDPARQQLRQRLQVTDCIILCVSGENLAEPLTLKSRAKILRNIDAHLLNSLTDEFVHGIDNKLLSLAIVITKYDLCQKRGTDTFEDIKQIFPFLFGSRGWIVMICPVTLGLKLSEDITAPISPKNIHIPIVFSLITKMIKIQWESLGLYNISETIDQERLIKQKHEITRLASLILGDRQRNNSSDLPFHTYLNGVRISWNEVFDEDE